MLVTLLKRLGFGTLIGVFIALIGVAVVLSVRMLRSMDSYTKLWESRVKSAYVRLVEIAHAAYHTLQVELLNAHHAIHVEVLSVHHVIQVDVTRHRELWLKLSGTLTFGDLFMFLGALLVALGLLLVAAAIRRHAYATEHTAAWEYKRRRDITLAYEQELRQERVNRPLRSRAAFRPGAGTGSRHTTHGTRTRLMLR
jgi:drug/metabolite transporter (DMT)-like permease